jgi:hypothetical protein
VARNCLGRLPGRDRNHALTVAVKGEMHGDVRQGQVADPAGPLPGMSGMSSTHGVSNGWTVAGLFLPAMSADEEGPTGSSDFLISPLFP